jgi:hypothetical protein
MNVYVDEKLSWFWTLPPFGEHRYCAYAKYKAMIKNTTVRMATILNTMDNSKKMKPNGPKIEFIFFDTQLPYSGGSINSFLFIMIVSSVYDGASIYKEYGLLFFA